MIEMTKELADQIRLVDTTLSVAMRSSEWSRLVEEADDYLERCARNRIDTIVIIGERFKALNCYGQELTTGLALTEYLVENTPEDGKLSVVFKKG